MILQYWHVSSRSIAAGMMAMACTAISISALALDETINSETALKNCQAMQSETDPPVKKKNGPAKYLIKGAAQELSSNAKGIGEGLVFVFSAQDLDPYDKSAPKDKPYTALTVALVDGTTCSVIDYPDKSAKIVGGFADGTVIAPLGGNTYVVGYPNGARGKLVKLPSGYRIYRPDNTVTTIEKTMSGRFSITNDKLGYMGEAIPDRNGLSYEFKRGLE